MNIILFNSNADPIVVDKTEFLSNRLELNGTLRGSANLLYPVIDIEADYINHNYCYIEEFNRYYYISDITNIRNNLWRLNLSVDVLYSYKNNILNTNAWIGRSASNYDSYIKDPLEPFTWQRFSTTDNLFLINELSIHNGGCFYIVAVADNEDWWDTTPNPPFEPDYDPANQSNIPNHALNGINRSFVYYLFTDKAEFNQFVSHILLTSEHSSFIGGMWVYPFNTSDVISNINYEEQKVNSIKFGSSGSWGTKLSNIYALKNSNYISYEYSFTVTPHYSDYKIYEPFTEYQIYVPMYGYVKVKSYDILNKYCRIRFIIDLTTGECRVICTSAIDTTAQRTDEITVFSIAFQFAQPIPINSSNASDVERTRAVNRIALATSLITGTSTYVASSANTGMRLEAEAQNFVDNNPVGSRLSQSYGGFATSASDYFNTIVSSIANYTSNEILNVERGITDETGSVYLSYSSSKYCYLKQDFVFSSDTYKNSYINMVGKPCKRFGLLSSYHGFTVIDDVRLNDYSNATLNELKLINNILRKGIILP